MLNTYEEKKAFVQKFNIFDDTFFEMVVKDKDAVEDVLRIIFHEPELKVIKLIPQSSIKNLYGRSVRLDALCEMGSGDFINVEVQKADDDNHCKRTRYHASCITANVEAPGERFENIRDVYIVYISKFDIFNRKRRLYHVGKVLLDVKEEMIPVEDGEHFIYVNAASDVTEEAEDKEVAELMEYFKNSNGKNSHFPRLSERVETIKNEKQEVFTMCELVENYAKEYALEYAKEYAAKHVKEYAAEYAKEYAAEYAKEYAKEQGKKIAKEMLKEGEPFEKILRYTSLSLDEVKQLEAELMQPA